MRTNTLHNQTKAKEKRNLIIGGVVAITIGIIVYAGFGEEQGRITACEAFTKKYVTAEFSEETCEDVDVEDSEGNVTGTTEECDTEYWSKPASDIWTVVTYNNKLNFSNVENPKLMPNEYYTSEMPPTDRSWSKDYDFDNFKKHNDSSTKVYLDKNGVADFYTTKVSFNKQCNLDRKLENFVTIKTWYGNAYGSSN
jgi:hypothetical protein